MFNHTAVYALRAMAILGNLAPAECRPLRALAKDTNVPRHYLGKVMRRLVVGGLVQGRKGHGGGFALCRPPGDITFADILACADITVASDICVFDWGRCHKHQPCPLHSVWSKFQKSVEEWATTTTLAETRTQG